MLLNELHIDWRQDNTFTYRLDLIEYHCKVKYLPFGIASRVKNEKTDLSKIYTPVFHFEFEAVNSVKTIYQSHWIMPYTLAWFLENFEEPTIKDMVVYAAEENGYLQRILKLTVNYKKERNYQSFKTTQMRERVSNLPLRWIFRLAIIGLASYITGLSFWWCFLAYIGIMFLIEFAKNMIIVVLGIIIVIGISLAMFFGLLTL